ncbi:MAG: M24 family metallopeptidase, partial [Thermodesulfobacteriota bacterium]
MTTNLYRLRQSLKQRKIDAFLITSPENRRYLSGFSPLDGSLTESSGALLIPAEGSPYLLTDSRFKLEAEKEAQDFQLIVYSRGFLSSLKKLLKLYGISRLAVEGKSLLHSTFLKMNREFAGLGTEILPLEGVVENMRLCKSAGELQKIREAIRLNEIVFQEVYRQIKPGMTEIEIALRLEQTMRLKGAEGAAFTTIVAGGPGGASPHALPSRRPLQEGEPIIIDMGLILNGYCSDMSRTIILGSAAQQTVKRFRLVRKAQKAAINAVRAGVSARDVDSAARELIAEEGMRDKFCHGLGHGVGL